MYIAILQGGQLATSQKSLFQVCETKKNVQCHATSTIYLWSGFAFSVIEKLDMVTDDMKELRFADA